MYNKAKASDKLNSKLSYSADLFNETPCWLWSGFKDENGYGRVWFGTKGIRTHRLSYELNIGPIPEGLVIDHLCRNRACCNPAHLEPVTNEENVRRGVVGKATRERQLAKTHCPQGHEYSEENTYRQPSAPKIRYCRTCRKQRDKDRPKRRRKPK